MPTPTSQLGAHLAYIAANEYAAGNQERGRHIADIAVQHLVPQWTPAPLGSPTGVVPSIAAPPPGPPRGVAGSGTLHARSLHPPRAEDSPPIGSRRPLPSVAPRLPRTPERRRRQRSRDRLASSLASRSRSRDRGTSRGPRVELRPRASAAAGAIDYEAPDTQRRLVLATKAAPPAPPPPEGRGVPEAPARRGEQGTRSDDDGAARREPAATAAAEESESEESSSGEASPLPEPDWGRGTVIVTPEERGPSQEESQVEFLSEAAEALEPGQPHARVNLVVASLVLGLEGCLRDWCEEVARRRAGVLLLSWEPGGLISRDDRDHVLRNIIHRTGYSGRLADCAIGAVLWHTARVRACIHLGTCTQGMNMCEAWLLVLIKQRPSDAEEIAVAGMFRRSYVGCRFRPWAPTFQEELRTMLLGCRVRIVAGIFDAPASELGVLLRSCGAAGRGALGLALYERGAGCHVTHPHYFVVLGPAQVRECHPQHQPPLPEYWNEATHPMLHVNGVPCRLAHFMQAWVERPTWCVLTTAEREDQGTVWWSHLNQVKLKPTPGTMLTSTCHTLLIHVDSKGRQSGRGAEARKKGRKREKKLARPEGRSEAAAAAPAGAGPAQEEERGSLVLADEAAAAPGSAAAAGRQQGEEAVAADSAAAGAAATSAAGPQLVGPAERQRERARGRESRRRNYRKRGPDSNSGVPAGE